MFKTTRRSIQPSRRRNNKVFMKIDKQMDNDLYHITIKRNFRGKKLTISAKNDRNTTKRADFKINLPRKAAKEMLKSKFDGSFANLTDNLCIKNRRLLLINPKANLENIENQMQLSNMNPMMNENSDYSLEPINEGNSANVLLTETQNSSRISPSKTAQNDRAR